MSDYGKMTDEQLICNLRAGEQEITDYIMDKYKFLVKKKAKEMYLLGGENDDLIQEGMIGLFKAVRDYDSEQGTSFASLQIFVSQDRCTVQSRRLRGRNICR